jgi:hypothetical protein
VIDLAATIDAMKASGMSADDIVRALACVQVAETPTSTRTARQERNRRYYLKASEKRLKASEQGVSDGDVMPQKESPQTPKEKTEPPKENTPLRGVQKKRGHRLPSGFTMPDEWRDWAIQRGLPPERVPVEFEKLTNWAANAPDSKGAKSDWFKAWQNWVIEAIDRLPRNRDGPAGGSVTMLDVGKRLLSEMRQADAKPDTENRGHHPPLGLLSHAGTG